MATESYRPVLSAEQLAAVIFELDNRKVSVGTLDAHAELALIKLKTMAFKARIGAVKPAYVSANKQSNSITLEALGATDIQSSQSSAIVSTKEYTGIDRRNQPIYTADEIEDAKFKAADHYIQTGVHKDYQEFLPAKSIDMKREEDNNSNIGITDDALFKAL